MRLSDKVTGCRNLYSLVPHFKGDEMLAEMAMASAIQMSLEGDISLEKWEECASARGVISCPLPAGASAFKACLDQAETAGIDATSICEAKSFPECFSEFAPDDTQHLLRLCGAHFSISARWVAEEWMVDIRASVSKDELEAFEATVIAPIFALPYTNISNDLLEASAERQGSWRSVLNFTKSLKTALKANL